MTLQEQQVALKHVKAIQKNLGRWKKHAPINHEHRWHLIEAEYHRVVTGKAEKALEHYKKAISIAQQNGFVSFEAIGNELLGKYYLSQQENDFAEFYFQKALFKYQQWGAISKAECLINDYPRFLARIVYPSNTMSYSLSPSLSYSNNSNSQNYDSINPSSLNVYNLLNISQELLSETRLPKLIERILEFSLETAGAQIAYLMLVKNTRISVEAKVRGLNLNKEEKIVELLPSVSLKEFEGSMSHTVINYVMRTQQFLVLDNAQEEERFKKDSYIKKNKVLSVFCIPILQKEKMIGLIYLENNLTTNAFSRERLELMKVLSPQIAIAIENTQLYNTFILQNEKQKELNDKLVHQNEDLQQFTYITSHNLREPVSNLLGLLELYNEEEPTDPINQIVIDGFKEASTNMDTILRSLSRIISAKKKNSSKI